MADRRSLSQKLDARGDKVLGIANLERIKVRAQLEVAKGYRKDGYRFRDGVGEEIKRAIPHAIQAGKLYAEGAAHKFAAAVTSTAEAEINSLKQDVSHAGKLITRLVEGNSSRS